MALHILNTMASIFGQYFLYWWNAEFFSSQTITFDRLRCCHELDCIKGWNFPNCLSRVKPRTNMENVTLVTRQETARWQYCWQSLLFYVNSTFYCWKELVLQIITNDLYLQCMTPCHSNRNHVNRIVFKSSSENDSLYYQEKPIEICIKCKPRQICKM